MYKYMYKYISFLYKTSEHCFPVLNLFPDTVNSLVARSVTKLINSYAVNRKTGIILGNLLYSRLCFNVFMFCILCMFY